MSDIVEITGDWIGYYSYGKGYSESQKDLKVPFRMTLKRGINQFVGRIFEEVEYGGIDDEIVIRGVQNGDEIEFTKHYTLEHYSDDNETVSFESENPTIVYYRGRYNDIEKTFKGEWEIPVLEEDEEGVFHEDNSSGSWAIWREA